MGSIRNVLYGYSIEKGVIVLNREEAPIVFEAFNRYCVGEILKDIADSFTERGIAYYRDKTAWTKNIICRMIENRNYVGNDKYPPIISDEIYTIANQKKQEKGSQKTVLPPITEHIEEIGVQSPMDLLEKQFDSVMIPPTLHNVHTKAAITERNRWMVENCDLLIAHVVHERGGAWTAMRVAEQLGMPVLRI